MGGWAYHGIWGTTVYRGIYRVLYIGGGIPWYIRWYIQGWVDTGIRGGTNRGHSRVPLNTGSEISLSGGYRYPLRPSKKPLIPTPVCGGTLKIGVKMRVQNDP